MDKPKTIIPAMEKFLKLTNAKVKEIKVCAEYGKAKLGGLESSGLPLIPFGNATHCEHCQVKQLEDKVYEVSCNESFVSVDKDKVDDSVQDLGMVVTGTHSPIYLPKWAPLIGEYRSDYQISCWDFKKRKEPKVLIPENEAIKEIKLVFRHPTAGAVLWSVNPDAKNVNEIIRFLGIYH